MGCGCNKTSSSGTPSGDGFLLIKATAIGANQCDETSSEETDCLKQEPEYDSFLSGFLVPLGTSSISVQVCNSSVYSIGQWIESISPYCIFQIVAVSEGAITLRASLENGNEINVNPESGTAIPSGTLFVTRGKPQNLTEDEVLSVLNEQEQILVEDLIETTDTAEVHFVGVTTDDPGDTDWKKALRVIKGIYMKAKKLFMDEPIRVEPSSNFHSLARSSVTGEIVELENDSDTGDVEEDKQYVKSVTSDGEQLIEASFPFILSSEKILKLQTATTSTSIIEDITISDSEILNLEKRLQHYYLELDIYVRVGEDGVTQFNILIDGFQCGLLFSDSDVRNVIRFTYLVKIDKDENEFNLQITFSGSQEVAYIIQTRKVYR